MAARQTKQHLSFQTKLLSGFFVLSSLLVFFGWKMVQSSQKAEEDLRQVVRTHEVREALELVLLTLIDNRSSVGGYVITANPEFLGPFEVGIKAIDHQIATLRMLTSDNPFQQTKIDTLEMVVATNLEWEKGVVQTLRTEGRAAAASRVASGIGKLQMERIRSLISEMRNEQSRLLHERSEKASASASATRLMLYGSLLIMLILIAALFVGTQRYRTTMEKTNTLLEKKVEERTAKLAASEREFRDLTDSALIGIYRTTLKGEIQYVNNTLARMMGFDSPAELIRDGTIARYRDPADRQAFIEKLQRDGKVESYELVLLNKSGAPLYALLSAQINGDIITGTILDITERKQAEEKFKGLIESAPDAIVIANSDGKIVQVNTQTERLFGFTRAELHGQTVEILLPQRFHAAHPKHRARYFAAPTTRAMGTGQELTGRHKDGSEFPVDVSLSMLETPEGHFAIAAIRDITERKRAEADRLARETAERANQAKSEFLSRMSHELRTPLNSILGFSQLLEMDPLKPDQLQNVRHILKSGRHLLSLVNEVLDIARIESGRMTLSPETVHLEEALLPSIELIRPLAAQRGISISVKLPSSKDIFITADLQRLKQVLLNLLSNAVKYNRDNGSIHVGTSLLADGFLRLTIMDTGKGIPTEKMDRLFKPFDRLDLDDTKSEGTGLGLALSRGLMEAMGGRIGAESELGKGTTFRIDLPLTTEQTEAIVMAEVDEHLKSVPASHKGVILHVEDNLANVQLIEKVISRTEGVELVTAMQGRMALDLAEQHQPSLILLDLHLPDINGLDVLRLLRENPKTKHIPVVMMSAEAGSRKIQEALVAGAQRYLTKPINVTEFLQMIKEVLTG